MSQEIVETRACCDCGRPFTVTPEELAHLARLVERGKIKRVITPHRCRPCRAVARAHRNPPPEEAAPPARGFVRPPRVRPRLA